MNTETAEREIKMSTLMYRVLRRWRGIVVFGLLAALALGGYKGLRLRNSQEGQEQETDSELRSLAADYLKAVAEGNRAKLLRWCAANEGMDGRAAVDFIDCVRSLVADMLCSRQKARGMERAELMELYKLLDECAARLKVNAGVKHIFGLLAVNAIDSSGNRGSGID